MLLFFLFAGKVLAVELVFWNFWDPKFILPVISRFEAEHPGIRIRNEQLNWGNGLDKIVTALANGVGPDICELGSTWTGKFMAQGALLDLTDKVRDLVPAYLLWEPVTWGGRLYGMPWLVSTRVLFFNRTRFREAGLDPDRPPGTWDELLACAQALHQPTHGKYGFGMNAGEGHVLYKKFLPFVWGNEGAVLAASGTFVFDRAPTREALVFYQKLNGFSLREKQDLLDEAFMRGRLGLEISGSWNFARFPKEAPDLDFGVGLIPKPAPEKGHTSSFLGGQVLALFRKCSDPAGGAEFIRFLTRPENTLPISRETLVHFPACRDALQDPFFAADQRFAVFFRQLATAVHPPVHPLWIELESIINDTVERALHGGDVDSLLKASGASFRDAEGLLRERESARQARQRSPEASAREEGGALGGWGLPLLTVTAVGTLLNAILLVLIYREVKKNGG